MIKLFTGKEGVTYAVLKNDQISKWAQEQGTIVVEQIVPLRLVKFIRPGDTVVDVGACIGDHTVEYAKAVGHNGRVLAFEPYLPSFTCLMVNCRDLPQVQCIHAALADMSTTVVMSEDDHNVGATHIQRNTARAENASPNLRCFCFPLDSYHLSQCSFLKVDVEGFEPRVLRGAMETIKRCRPVIYTEINRGALERFGESMHSVIDPLVKLGYRMELADPRYGLETDQTDVFFHP